MKEVKVTVKHPIRKFFLIMLGYIVMWLIGIAGVLIMWKIFLGAGTE